MNPDATFQHAKDNDAIVAKMLRAGASLESIIGQLAAEKERWLNLFMEMESVAPRKIIMPDGKVMLWQCPHELLPASRTFDYRKT